MNARELLALPAGEALAEGFAQTLVGLAAPAVGETVLASLRAAARAASLATSAGHSCARLAELPEAAAGLPALVDRLLASGLVASTASGERRPLVVDAGGRLYLYRYFEVERRLAARLRGFGPSPLAAADAARIAGRLDERFGAADAAAPDLQRRAVALALDQRLAIVSGGPGTGKTTIVVHILALRLELDPACRIRLAAPTGKAAARLRDAVHAAGAALPEALRARLPASGETVHRLLAEAAADGDRLACDLLVVDEASMLDLVLAERLLAVLGPQTQLILLGDRHQLAAVEAGAVFAEISSGDPPPLPVIELRHSYRFAADAGLGRLAAAARDGAADTVFAALAGGDPDLALDTAGGAELPPAAIATLAAGYTPYAAALAAGESDPQRLFAAFNRFRVLAALRDGPRGVAGLNATLSRAVRAVAGQPVDNASPWFAGRPLLVTRNDPLLHLFNGDVGIALPAPGGGFRVWFEDAAAPGGFRAVPTARLPAHETALAMTVHKAQGSEFDAVALVLPNRPAAVCTREMVYTGITRARRSVTIFAPADVLSSALAAPTVRHSGLRDRLLEPDAN